MKLLTVLILCLALAGPALAAAPLTESNITDEPSAAPSKAANPPAKTGTAAAPAVSTAPVPAPAPAPTPAPAAATPAPAGQWTPPESSAPAGPEGSPGLNQSQDIFHSPEATQVQVSTYSRKEVDQEVMGFFEGGARGLAQLTSKAFDKYGQPVGFIKGNEGAGALIVGFRYGEGWLYLKNGQKAYVYWQSPSLGLDLGVDACKVFCMVYNMTDVNQIYQRFPGVDGSAYVIGGFGMNYQRSGDVILAPIRFGVGLRLGANVGYMHFTKERTPNPF